MSRFGWAFVNDVIIGTGSAGTGSAVDGPTHAVVVKDGGIISGATNFNFNNSTGFGQLTGSLAISSNLTVNGNLSSGPITATTITATTNLSASSLTGTLRSNTGNKFGSAAGDVHQFTGSISAGIVSGTTAQFTTVSGSTLTGSNLLTNTATVNSATISTLTSTTNTSNVLYVTGATNSIISGKEINSLGSLSVSNTIQGSPLSLENTTAFYIKPDGSRLYAHDTTSAELVECTLLTPWDTSAASVSRTSTYLDTPVASSIASGLTFKPDGTKAYILLSSPTSEQLYETTLSVPWDLSYASAWTLKVRLTGSGAITGQKGISISEDGRYLFTCSGSTVNSFVLKYTMSTPWDTSTVSHTTPVSASIVLEAATKNSTISNDGKSILILDASNYLHDFELLTPYELTTVTKKSSVSLNTLSPTYGVSSGIFLKPDQTKIFFNAANGSDKYFISLAMTSSQVDLVGGIHITGDAKITQNINVYGDATFEDLSGSNAQFRILSASSVDINGGTIDGTTIATSDITVGSGKTLSVSAGTLTLAAAQIGADKIAGATFGAGTYSFSGRTISNLGTVTTADINGGTIDGTTIGVTSATTGKFTELTASTNLSASQIFLGTGGMTASSNIVPLVTNTYDLGSTNNRWRDIYVSSSINVPNISATNITGTTLVSGATGFFTTVNAPTLNGNASTATNLATARTLTIGNTGKTFDGSAAVSWSLTEIGAAQTGSNNTFTGINTFNTNYITGSITGSDAKHTSLTASSGKFTTLSASSTLQIGGDTTLGTAATTTTINGQTTFNEIVTVSAAKTFTAGTVDINGGAIDGTNITVGSGKTLNVSAGTLTLAAGQITNNMLATISGSGKVTNAATTATELNTANAIIARDSSGNFQANSAILSSSISIKDGTDTGIYLDSDSGLNVSQVSVGNGTTHAGLLSVYTQFSVTSASRVLAKFVLDEFDGTPNYIFVDPTGDLRIKNASAFTAGTDGSAEGTIVGTQSFTGIHFYDIHDNEQLETGDVVVIENFKIKKSTIIKQKNVVGIFVGMTQHNTYKHSLTNEKSGSFAAVASVGDNRDFIFNNTITGFKICNQNGPVESGDLLCTSNVTGYLMKQDDDIIRSTTVGKALENVIFDSNGKATGIYGYLYCG